MNNYLIKFSNYTKDKFQLTYVYFKSWNQLSSELNQAAKFHMQSAIMYLSFEFIGHFSHVSQTSVGNNWSEEYHTVGVFVMYTPTNIRYFWCTLMRNWSRIWTDFVSKKEQKNVYELSWRVCNYVNRGNWAVVIAKAMQKFEI